MRLLFFAMAAFVGAVLAWVLAAPHRTVVHERSRVGPTLVVVRTPRTPLRDSIREPKRQAQRGGRGRTSTSSAPRRDGPPQVAASDSPKSATTAPQKRRVPPKTRRTTRRPRKPAQPGTGPYTAPTQPAPQQPAVGVRVPAPVTVCARPAATVNC